jgi:hypothetical protein
LQRQHPVTIDTQQRRQSVLRMPNVAASFLARWFTGFGSFAGRGGAATAAKQAALTDRILF